ncbi:MAG: ATP-binding cassette domain-containing protein [Candidatus Desulfofervidus sp.]|nr:ATP-binding cassette domain-containing protein [Candidatus Desulfofervidus sp.]
MSETILAIQNLSKKYKIKTHPFSLKYAWLKAVNDVSLNIRKGELLGLVGESGCGKTTLAKLLLFLEKPDQGKIQWENTLLTGLGPKKLKFWRRLVQPIFQDPFASLNPKQTINQILQEPLLIHHLGDSRKRNRAVNQVLTEVGLSPKLKTAYPHQLSGGQRQRIAIARALILKPEFIIADEPTSALDVSVQAQIVNLLLESQAKRQITYLFISHNLSLVANIAERIAVMYMGKVIEIMERNQFLGEHHPYTEVLWSSIPRLERKTKINVQQWGEPPNPLSLPSGCVFHPRCKQKIEICKKEAPSLKEIKPGHWIACHLF